MPRTYRERTSITLNFEMTRSECAGCGGQKNVSERRERMFDNVIAQDCQAMYDSKKRVTVIADGKVVGFEDEENVPNPAE